MVRFVSDIIFIAHFSGHATVLKVSGLSWSQVYSTFVEFVSRSCCLGIIVQFFVAITVAEYHERYSIYGCCI